MMMMTMMMMTMIVEKPPCGRRSSKSLCDKAGALIPVPPPKPLTP